MTIGEYVLKIPLLSKAMLSVKMPSVAQNVTISYQGRM